MTTTLNVRLNGQVELPEDFCRRKKIKPGTVLRVTEVGGGLFVTPLTEPTESEMKAVLSAAGSLTRTQTPAEEDQLQQVIAGYRHERRQKQG